MLKIFVIFVCFTFCYGYAAQTKSFVRNLVGEPDYRKVQLHWEADRFNVPPSANFQIRYCELQSWGPQRCRMKFVDHAAGSAGSVDDVDSVVDEDERDLSTYSTEVGGLRMATTYSFEVKLKSAKDAKSKEVAGLAGLREERADGDDGNQSIIVIPTKGFSARATQCLPHASEIEVSTGPHFAGRIAVEATDGERCAIDGEPHSSRDTYTLRINHAECGSAVNETTVATFVLVQENLPILTHSTRRFLVLCTYQPETLTVRAGLNLPTHQQRHYGHGKVTLEEDNSVQQQQQRGGRSARVLQRPEALVNPDEESDVMYFRVPLVLIALLMIVGISVGLLEVIRRRIRARLAKEGDTHSIASTSSCNTVA